MNSDDPGAAITNGGTITAPEVDITGGTTVTGGKGGFYGGVNLGTPPQPDPLRFIPEPDPLSLTEQSENKTQYSNGDHTLYPGVYHGGISISGQGQLDSDAGHLLHGRRRLLDERAGQNLYAAGVMIFNAPQKQQRYHQHHRQRHGLDLYDSADERSL